MYNVSNRFGDTFYVSFGSNSLLKKRSFIKAKTVHLHPNFSQFENNIGLIEVEEDIIFNQNVKPVELPKSSSDPIGDSVVIAGWGSSKFGV